MPQGLQSLIKLFALLFVWYFISLKIMLYHIGDRLVQLQLRRDEKEIKAGFFITGAIIAILLANILYLNFSLIEKQKNSNSQASELLAPVTSPLPTALPTPLISPSVSLPAKTSPAPTATDNVGLQRANLQPSVNDYFIPCGSGTNQTSDWADVPGTVAAIDFGRYQTIKEIRFEASVYLPASSQIVSVRLYNKTDKHPVWYSEVKTDGNATASLTSSPIIYDKGEKLYQVQMKNQLEAPANLVQARIHVILQ